MTSDSPTAEGLGGSFFLSKGGRVLASWCSSMTAKFQENHGFRLTVNIS